MKNRIKLLIAILAVSISIIFSNSCAFAGVDVSSVDRSKTEFATKAPLGKRDMAMKFVLAMLGVATSSVVIYVMLSLYNRFIYKGSNDVVVNEDDNDFKTPTNLKEAINIFLKKTK